MQINYLHIMLSFSILCLFNIKTKAQCSLSVDSDKNGMANSVEIYCGDSVQLNVEGLSIGLEILTEDFNSGGFGNGWSSTPGAVNFSNPCSPLGVDGTPHAWMDNNTDVPRLLQSASYDLSAAAAGVTICFDLLFAEQGDASPCEGPDEPDEGVYLEYSIDGGVNWVQIHYFDPVGGHNAQLINWNNWCFQIPLAAISPNTAFRWRQDVGSGADNDHWGIDNVQIFENDINSEIRWLHDNYTYPIGSTGGINPNKVAPTSTTNYTVQLTTGLGTVCTTDFQVIVKNPSYNINLNANPNPICPGECAQIEGTADLTFTEGVSNIFEDNTYQEQTGTPSIFGNPGSVQLTDSIEVSGLYNQTITNNSINKVCITSLSLITPTNPGALDLSMIEIVLQCPSGNSINLVNAGDLTGSLADSICFITGGIPISSGTSPYNNEYAPAEPFSNLTGCNTNGEWKIYIQGTHNQPGFLTIPKINSQGWFINFDSPPNNISPTYEWSPSLSVSDPLIEKPEVCPTSTTTYKLVMTNGNPGCATDTSYLTVNVNPCPGCTPPTLVINNLDICATDTGDLSNAIAPASDLANISFYGSPSDANSSANPISPNVTAEGSYWVRAEDPHDPNCFEVSEIQVSKTIISYSTLITDENCDAFDGEIVLNPTGGSIPYTFSIDGGTTTQNNDTFSGLTGGAYNIEITDNNGCLVSGTEYVSSIGEPIIDDITTTGISCNGICDGEISISVSGGTAPYTYQWFDENNMPIGTNNNEISGLCAGTYSVEVSTSMSTCSTTELIVLTEPNIPDPSFSIKDYCENQANNATVLGDTGGHFSFTSPVVDGATIDSVTGEIYNGIGGTTYTVKYTTYGNCPESSVELVTVQENPIADFNANPQVTDISATDISFSNESFGAVDYYWDFGDGSAEVNSFNTNHIYPEVAPKQYTVKLKAISNFGCRDSISKTISIVLPKTQYKIPNIFTPNNDQQNDVFKLINAENIKDLKIVVLNRWGNVVFESDKIDFKWNGKLNNTGDNCVDGTYLYKITIKNYLNQKETKHGYIQLSRGQ